MDAISIVFTCLTLFVFGMIIFFVWAFIRDRRNKTRNAGEAVNMGYVALQPVPGLISRIYMVYGSPKVDRFELQNAFYKRIPEGDLYLFDIVTQYTDKYQEAGSSHAPRVFALVAPGLSLPQFSVFPHVAVGGMVGQVFNQLFSQAISADQPPIPFGTSIGFANRYQVAGMDEFAIGQVLTPDKLERISRYENLVIKAGGDVITVFRPPVPTAQPLLDWSNDALAVLKIIAA